MTKDEILNLLRSASFQDRHLSPDANISMAKASFGIIDIDNVTVISPYAVQSSDAFIYFNVSAAAGEADLPPASTATAPLILKCGVNATSLNVVPNGSDTIDASGPILLNPGDTLILLPPGSADNSTDWKIVSESIDLTGGDPLHQYFILAGRLGGQTGNGGTGAGDNLILGSTANGTKGKVGLGGNITDVYVDDVNKKLNIGAPRTTTARVNVETNDTATVGVSVRAHNSGGVSSATGGTITDSGGYRIHTFLAGDTFVIPTGGPTTVYPTLVAGGGAGGGAGAGPSGGGGAGGVIQPSAMTIAPGSFSVVVGAGGAGSSGTVVGANGTDSTFNGLDAVGGGGGSYNSGSPPAANNGGSGGGGANRSGAGGTGTASQGNAGGTGGGAGTSASAGGGGAGAAGGNGGPGTVGGNGGNGVTISSFGQAGTYGGGGGGSAPTDGTGGTGGGGDAHVAGNGSNGTANTGGGGGGSNVTFTAGSGGSGIVVISYLFGGAQSANLQEFQDNSGAVLSAVDANGNITTQTAGVGYKVKEGTNACMGIATLSGGTIVVNNTKVTANSRILLTTQGGTLTNVGTPYISARTAGTSFTIKSTNASDASDVAWLIMEPS